MKLRLNLNLSNSGTRLLYLLLIADLVYVIIHLVYMHTPILSSPEFKLGRERGPAENYQYLKEFWTALLLGLCGWKNQSKTFVYWSGLFFYFLADDSIRLHERAGKWIGYRIDQAGFYTNLGKGEDLGQLIYMGIVGSIILLLLCCVYFRSSSHERETSRTLLFLIFILAASAGGLDFVHSFLASPIWDSIMTVLEDGSEHIVMTLAFAFSFSLLDRGKSDSEVQTSTAP